MRGDTAGSVAARYRAASHQGGDEALVEPVMDEALVEPLLRTVGHAHTTKHAGSWRGLAGVGFLLAPSSARSMDWHVGIQAYCTPAA